jgi:hypothetical protein
MQYMVFEYDRYARSGGLADCQETFATYQEAITYCKNSNYEYYQIFDRLSGAILNDSIFDPVK